MFSVGGGVQGHLTIENVQMANRHMQKRSLSLAMREVQTT